MKQFETPILFLVFNRYETAQQVFNEIRKQQPKQLFVAADGPRPTKPGEAAKCEKVRSIVNQIDWDCDLQTLYRTENLGCAKAVSSAISWFFDQVEEGIILEDDCLPHPDFFPYCEFLLEYYRNNEKIMCISGNNFQNGIKRGDASYYFSAYTNIWGWATWRRAWQGCDLYLKDYEFGTFKNVLTHYGFTWNERQVWIDRFLIMKKQGINTWDYQFMFHVWQNNGLSINPNVNLVSNIGVGEDATHTNDESFSMLNCKVASIFPIQKNEIIRRDDVADSYFYKNHLQKTILQLLWRWLKQRIGIKQTFSDQY